MWFFGNCCIVAGYVVRFGSEKREVLSKKPAVKLAKMLSILIHRCRFQPSTSKRIKELINHQTSVRGDGVLRGSV